jgi:hypothetical protein
MIYDRIRTLFQLLTFADRRMCPQRLLGDGYGDQSQFANLLSNLTSPLTPCLLVLACFGMFLLKIFARRRPSHPRPGFESPWGRQPKTNSQVNGKEADARQIQASEQNEKQRREYPNYSQVRVRRNEPDEDAVLERDMPSRARDITITPIRHSGGRVSYSGLGAVRSRQAAAEAKLLYEVPANANRRLQSPRSYRQSFQPTGIPPGPSVSRLSHNSVFY